MGADAEGNGHNGFDGLSFADMSEGLKVSHSKQMYKEKHMISENM